MRETDHYYLFWKHQFGQWTIAPMTDKAGLQYNCCEQYMMAQKALLFHDPVSYDAIMMEQDPAKQQELGRAVTSFDRDTWQHHRFSIVCDGNLLKFQQHEELKQRLLHTGQKILVEASPTDLIWGIGFGCDAPEATTPEKWRGQNLLGQALMFVRQRLHLNL